MRSALLFYSLKKQQYLQMRSHLSLDVEIKSLELVSQLKELIIVRNTASIQGESNVRVTNNITGNIYFLCIKLTGGYCISLKTVTIVNG